MNTLAKTPRADFEPALPEFAVLVQQLKIIADRKAWGDTAQRIRDAEEKERRGEEEHRRRLASDPAYAAASEKRMVELRERSAALAKKFALPKSVASARQPEAPPAHPKPPECAEAPPAAQE